MVAALVLFAAGCQPDVGSEAPPPPAVGRSRFGLSTISCSESTDTGYKSGTSFKITVVTVDGKKVERDTANAYYVMAKAAAKAGVTLKVVSGFRTNAEQTYLYNCYKNCNCNNCNLAARPGYSNHQSGHALDLNTSSSGVYTWLSNHGASYGFKRTVPSESWHWEWWGGGPGGGPCGKSPLCPASGKTKVCVDKSKIGTCDSGHISVGDCGAFGAYCSTAGVSQARCVSVFCVSDPMQVPVVHDTCIPGNKVAHCDKSGSVSSTVECAANEKCVVTNDIGTCRDPSALPPDAGASADVLDDAIGSDAGASDAFEQQAGGDSGAGVGASGDSATSNGGGQLRGAGCRVGGGSAHDRAPSSSLPLVALLLALSRRARRRRRRRRRRSRRRR